MGERAAPRVVSSEAPAEAAGQRVADALARAIAARGRARLAIPGGSALAAALEARARLEDGFRRVALSWVDERCVDEADPESNRGAAGRAGLLDPPPARTLPLVRDGEPPEAALARVRAAWRAELGGALDVVLLGMGPDGHVASLFPGRAWEGDVALFVADSPKPPAARISLTRAALATAGATILLAAGEPKRAALERLVAGDPALPATGLPGLVVVTDLELRTPA